MSQSEALTNLKQLENILEQGSEQTRKIATDLLIALMKSLQKESEQDITIKRKNGGQSQDREENPTLSLRRKAIVDPEQEIDNSRELAKNGFESLNSILEKDSVTTVSIEDKEYQITKSSSGTIDISTDNGETQVTYQSESGNIEEVKGDAKSTEALLAKLPELAREVSKDLKRSDREAPIDPEPSRVDSEDGIPKKSEPNVQDPSLEEEEKVDLEDIPPPRKSQEDSDLEDLNLEPKAESELLYGFDSKGNFIQAPLSPDDAKAVLALMDGRTGEIIEGDAGKNLIIEFGGKVLFETNEHGEITTNVLDDPNGIDNYTQSDKIKESLSKLRSHAQRHSLGKDELEVRQGLQTDVPVSSDLPKNSQSDSLGDPLPKTSQRVEPDTDSIVAPFADEQNPGAEFQNTDAAAHSPLHGITSPGSGSGNAAVKEDLADLAESEEIYILDNNAPGAVSPNSPIAKSLNQPQPKAPAPTVENYLAVLEESVLKDELSQTDVHGRVKNKPVNGHTFNRNAPSKRDGSYSLSIKVDGNTTSETIGSVTQEGVFTPNPNLKNPERIKEAVKEILVARGIDLEADRSSVAPKNPEIKFSENPDLSSQPMDFSDDPTLSSQPMDFADIPDDFAKPPEITEDDMPDFDDNEPDVTLPDRGGHTR